MVNGTDNHPQKGLTRGVLLGALEHSADRDSGACRARQPAPSCRTAAGRSPADAASWVTGRRARRPGAGPLHYQFKICALDQMLTLPSTATRLDVLKAIDGHIVGTHTHYAYIERLPQ